METLTRSQPETNPNPEKSVEQMIAEIKNQAYSEKNPFLDEIEDPWAAAEIDFASQSIEDLTEQTLQKIERKLEPDGSGWYHHKFTGERFHLQFYDDPDQARTEFISNSIYQHLGIKTPETELVAIDDRLAIATAEIPEAENTDREEQCLSADVRAGFVADAYLANTDVIGSNYDNIITGPGGFYRSMAAGSLTFAANGQTKDFDPNQIPELQTMLDPRHTSGQVFAKTFDSEISNQARQLVGRLDIKAIDGILAESEITGPRAETIRQGLVGRLQFLAEQFVDQKEATSGRDCRLGRSIDNLDTKEARSQDDTGEKLFRAYDAFLSDGDHIEAQTVSVIDSRADRGCLELKFKLTAKRRQEVLKRIIAENSDQLRLGKICYQSSGDDRSATRICDTIDIPHGDLKVQLAIDPETKQEINPQTAPKSYPQPTLSAQGLVNIEIPCYDVANDQPKQELEPEFSVSEPDFAQIEDQINEVLIDLLGIPGGLTEPDPEAERQHKIDRWAWHHKLDPNQLDPQQIAAAEKLQRAEVSPGCWSMIETGKHKEYQEKYGSFAFFHRIYEPITLIPILESQSLMSSHRRYSLGVLFEGLSTMEDFQTGGADSTFSRLVVERPDQIDPESKQQAQLSSSSECILVLKPSLADRVDYNAYSKDNYGSTDPEELENRLSPDEMFAEQLKTSYRRDNEQMFAGGISGQQFENVAFLEQPKYRWQLTEALMTKILPEKAQREAVFDLGPEAVQDQLEKAFGIEDPVNSLWEAGPQVLADFLASHNIDEILCQQPLAGQSLKTWKVQTDEWLRSNPRMRLIEDLLEVGIEEVNGQPIAQFVTEVSNHYDFIDLVDGQPPRSKPNWANSYQKYYALYGQKSPPTAPNPDLPDSGLGRL